MAGDMAAESFEASCDKGGVAGVRCSVIGVATKDCVKYPTAALKTC